MTKPGILMSMSVPLAEAMRPKRIDDIVGQESILGHSKIISEIIRNQKLPNLIFWGPPGSGKTTLARVLVAEFEADFIELSAVISGKKDIERVIEQARVNQNLQIVTILFVDEIHRFSKSQQDAFLPHVESGLITLIGATTENPSFEIIRPLLSRSRVVVLQPHSEESLKTILTHALSKLGASKKIDDESLQFIARVSSGDARIALGTLELALSLIKGRQKITTDIVKIAMQTTMPRYDKNGEMHYDLISAFIKSMRGSDTTAACYYMERMLQAGEDPKFIARRMVIFASEDIGLAGNGALSLANAVFAAVEKTGMPECRYALYHGVVALSRSMKSRELVDIMAASQQLVQHFPDTGVPLVLRNAPTELMKDMGYGKGYSKKKSEDFLPQEIARYIDKKEKK